MSSNRFSREPQTTGETPVPPRGGTGVSPVYLWWDRRLAGPALAYGSRLNEVRMVILLHSD